MPDTSVKLQDITPVKSTFDSDDQLLLINATGEARISKEDFLDAMPDDAITLIGDITTTGIEGDTVAKQLGALENSKAPVITETTESSAIANFTDGADDMVMHHVVAEINPVQSGSGDPSPSNIRPITGWTGCNVTRVGANLFDKSTASDNTTWTTSGTQGFSSGNTSSALIPVQPSGSFYVGFNGKANVYGVYEFDINKNYIGRTFAGALTPRAITLPSNCYYVGLVMGTTYVDTAFFSYPSTATTYEPYQASSISVDWTTEAGTVYGGTIDVATGLLTVTNGYIASYNGEALPSTWISDRDVYASGTTPTTGAQVVYALTTAQAYQLTGQQLMTLLGTNNVWADTGNVSVTYPADTKMFIEKLTQPTEDDMTANQAITSGKFFMVGNNLYIATAAIASGAKIIEGTNATRLSLADALNRL